jgi:predicted HTH domain antitoxin
MVTKSIRLTESEAADLRRYLDVTGEVEAHVLKRATMRGLRELRIEQGILAFRQGRWSSEAAEIAGLPRAEFLWLLTEKGITILEGPSALADELAHMAEQLGDERLAAIARELHQSRD